MSSPSLPSRDKKTISLEIDHRPVTCPEGSTILRAAERNGIYIPSLCSHKDLSPFGGCRLCMVEVEGLRGYPLACSTPAAEGQKVLTETAALKDMRREILELILSEHPSSCLLCGEKEECGEVLQTIRKSGVTTGCRYCPNDRHCELQTVVEHLGVTDIHYPIYYRGYEAEHDDPFFDRDYNVCILCGRCVRMCQEVRGTSVLAFTARGPKTQIGPAFGRNHVEAGCEFCGACLSVCPTGTLAEKTAKWDGTPDGSAVSTCPFCALGCQVELLHKDGSLSKAHPHLDAEINDGQLCVRGRFCMPEATHHHLRARKPMLKRGGYFREVSWPEALDEAAARIKEAKPEEFLMLVSPDLTNESLYTARKLVKETLGSQGIDSTARLALPGGAELWSRLLSLPVSINGLARAEAVLAVGLDSRFSFSVAGVEIRRALREGAKLVTVDHRESNLARYTDRWLRPRPGAEGEALLALAERIAAAPASKGIRTGGAAGLRDGDLDEAAAVLRSARSLAVMVGPAVFGRDGGSSAARALLMLGGRENTTFLPLFQGANTRGALELGILDGPVEGLKLDDILTGRAKPKVLYLAGEVPFAERPDCDFLIVQDTYLPPFEVDVFLPAASFVEAGGTLTNVEGRVQEVVQVECPPDGARTGFVRPDWFIFSQLSGRVSPRGFSYESWRDVLKDVSGHVQGFPAAPDRRPRRMAAKAGFEDIKPAPASAARGGFVLLLEAGGFRHRGIDLSHVVEGLSELKLEEGFRLHPEDISSLGLDPGGELTLAWNGTEVSF
ncbi:MAG: 2Fe-2S iron-sulfur cluster binding domain-containing protein, partial [Candidatus Aminicenantes bacterium]|nr:2Fe-2S iron-sulfur cluster binding domain-containing protein [Candidatus Aminicenantes bacterium]